MKSLFSLAGALFSISSFAQMPTLPSNLHCLNNQRQTMADNTSQIIPWKTTTPLNVAYRAFIVGKVSAIYPTQTNSHGETHSRIGLDLDNQPGGEIEIVYNDEFGALPKISVGTTITACGDFINTGPRGSPLNAIIHWTHYNPGERDGGKHMDGFLYFNHQVYGGPTLQ